MKKIPQRVKKARKHRRREADGWRKAMKLAEESHAKWWPENAAGPDGESGPSDNMNPQQLTERLGTDGTR